jgi:hypothetical protein
METKFIEIRDRCTCIAAMAQMLWPEEPVAAAFLARAGYGDCTNGGSYYVMLTMLDGMKSETDPYKWESSNRTMRQAHRYIRANWDDIKSGDVVDVEVLLGETTEPKTPEIYFDMEAEDRRQIAEQFGG